MKRRKPGRIDEARADAMLRSGLPLRSVARALRVRVPAVRAFAVSRGIPFCPVPSLSVADGTRILDMFRGGEAVVAIADALGVSFRIVRAFLSARGMRPRRGRAPFRGRGVAIEDDEAVSTPEYVCARCGRRKRVPGGGRRGLPFVVIGGRPWCERCAERRYPRRRNASSDLSPDAIP